MFTKAKVSKATDNERMKLMETWRMMFDKFLNFISLAISQIFVECVVKNMLDFKFIFVHPEEAPSFELTVCFDKDNLINVDPTF